MAPGAKTDKLVKLGRIHRSGKYSLEKDEASFVPDLDAALEIYFLQLFGMSSGGCEEEGRFHGRQSYIHSE